VGEKPIHVAVTRHPTGQAKKLARAWKIVLSKGKISFASRGGQGENPNVQWWKEKLAQRSWIKSVKKTETLRIRTLSAAKRYD